MLAATTVVALGVYACDVPEPPQEFIDMVTPSTTEGPPPPATTISQSSAVPTVQRSTVTTTTLPTDLKCPQWWPTLVAFFGDQARNADRVMWAESRCENIHRTNSGTRTAAEATALGVVGTGDHGLFQINRVHLDWLEQDWGITAEDLMVPAMNTVAALLLFDWAEDTYGCGWQPWYMSTDYERLCDG